jgi:arylsulfatase A-like enzyme
MPHTGPQDWESYLGFLNGYDAGIRHIDEKVGEIVALLERLGVREETAIIVSADHGESIGELGMYFEHGSAMEGTTRVPLIVDWPGMPGGVRSDGLVYQLDLPPTVLKLLGMEVPAGWHGTGFEAALQGETFDGRDHLVLSCGIYSFQRAVRTRTHRLVRTIHPGIYPYEPLYLFDMEQDPNQTRNIAGERPDLVAQLDHLLLEWTYAYTTGPAAQPDPFQVQLAAGITPDLYCPLEKMEARLAATGRDAALEDLRQRRHVPRPLSLTGQMVRQ